MKRSISPYPSNVTIKNNNVYVDGKYIGYIDYIENWGTNWYPRLERGSIGKYYKTKTLAVSAMIEANK